MSGGEKQVLVAGWRLLRWSARAPCVWSQWVVLFVVRDGHLVCGHSGSACLLFGTGTLCVVTVGCLVCCSARAPCVWSQWVLSQWVVSQWVILFVVWDGHLVCHVEGQPMTVLVKAPAPH